MKKENVASVQALDAKRTAFNELAEVLLKRNDDVDERQLNMRAHEVQINEYKQFEKFLRSREDLIQPQLDGLTEHAKQKKSDRESQLQDLRAREQIVKQREDELSQKRTQARFLRR